MSVNHRNVLWNFNEQAHPEYSWNYSYGHLMERISYKKFQVIASDMDHSAGKQICVEQCL